MVVIGAVSKNRRGGGKEGRGPLLWESEKSKERGGKGPLAHLSRKKKLGSGREP